MLKQLNTRFASLALVAVASALTGCASTFNTAGTSEFACGDRNDCPTPFEVYNGTNSAPESIRNGRTPEQWNVTGKEKGQKQAGANTAPMPNLNLTRAAATTVQLQDPSHATVQPMREPSQVMRIWIAPWIDQGDNLNWSGYVYTEVTPKRWAFGEREIRYQSLAPQFVKPQ